VPIVSDLQKLSLDAEVYLFKLSSFNPLNPFESFHFSPNTGIVFAGTQYIAIPCQITGISYSSEGALPRPKLEIGDPDGVVSEMIELYQGLEGAELEIRSTFKKYLDNQPFADSTASRIQDSYQISQKLRHVPSKGIEYELSSSIDVVEDSLPSRLAVNRCQWIYRSIEHGCPYSGSAMFDLNDRPTLDPKKDRCAKGITSCEKRFPKQVLPWGGFASGEV
jgi:lambda family phage minor tail protein L